MRRLITLFVLLVFASPALFTAEQQPLGAAATSAEPFKLGTFGSTASRASASSFRTSTSLPAPRGQSSA